METPTLTLEAEVTTDAERERVIDARVMRRLSLDSAYRNADSSDEQAQREDEITRQEEAQFDREAGKAAAA